MYVTKASVLAYPPSQSQPEKEKSGLVHQTTKAVHAKLCARYLMLKNLPVLLYYL